MDKTLTPFLNLIQQLENFGNDTFTTDEVVAMLKLELITERQFAETCFDAGFNSCKCNWGEQEPTFDNFFKQYTHD